MVGRDKDGRTAFINAAMAGDLKPRRVQANQRQREGRRWEDSAAVSL